MPVKGQKLSQEQKERMKEGKEKAKIKREAEAQLPAESPPSAISPTIPAPEPVMEPVVADTTVKTAVEVPSPVQSSVQSSDISDESIDTHSRAELRELKTEIEECDRLLGGVGIDGSQAPEYSASVDLGAVRRRKMLAERKLEQKIPRAATGIQQNKIRNEITRLESEITNGMPDMTEYYGTPTKNRDQAGLVGNAHRQLRWSQENTGKVLKWKKLLYKLDPDKAINEPDWTNVERIRPGRVTKHDTLAQKNDKIMSTGWNRPDMSVEEEQIKMTRNLSAEEVAEDLGISVEEVWSLRKGKELVEA
tara:strand:+ start:41 stop:958 length:918 start_codon:yes stop_codon:yes gene_type:complete